MKSSKCELVKNGKMRCKGKSSLEFYYNDTPYYYCYGYISKYNDELLEECKDCKSNVIYSQTDLDKLKRNNSKGQINEFVF